MSRPSQQYVACEALAGTALSTICAAQGVVPLENQKGVWRGRMGDVVAGGAEDIVDAMVMAI